MESILPKPQPSQPISRTDGASPAAGRLHTVSSHLLAPLKRGNGNHRSLSDLPRRSSAELSKYVNATNEVVVNASESPD
jgi:hypothetical protein